MNRLQKKCVVGTASVHLLLLVLLLCSGFIAPGPKMENLQVLDVIDLANLTDEPSSGGNAAPPPPIVTTPPAPPPVVTPVALPPLPAKTAEPVEPVKPAKSSLTQVTKQNTNPPGKIKISTELVTRIAPPGSGDTINSRAIRNTLKNLKSGLSSGTGSGVGGGGISSANYRDVVYSIYNHAWTLPANIANDDENVMATITIASDGTVLNSHIVTPSGDAPVDASVQRTLERVTFIAPFPKGAPQKERTYTINFNPKAKRMLE